MSAEPQVWLVCYDISDPKRLRRVYKAMRGHGEWLQYSVFRCVLTDIRLARLEARLGAIIHHLEDQVLFVPLGSASADRSWRLMTLGRPMDLPPTGARVF